MPIEHLDTDVRIPYDEEALKSGNPVRIAEYMLELVKTVQEFLEKITTATNYAIDIVPGMGIYFGLKQEDGTYPNGTWRIIRAGNDLEQQVKIAGVWTLVHRRERPV